jgi:hypothetical protein
LANACLLHGPRRELAKALALVWRALEAGGISTPASRPVPPKGGTRPVGTITIRRRIGGAPSTRTRSTGVHYRLRPAKSEASTASWRKCCSSWRGEASVLSGLKQS